MDAKTLKELRAAAGLTQAALAEQLRVSRALVARWETGSLQISARTALALRNLLQHQASSLEAAATALAGVADAGFVARCWVDAIGRQLETAVRSQVLSMSDAIEGVRRVTQAAAQSLAAALEPASPDVARAWSVQVQALGVEEIRRLTRELTTFDVPPVSVDQLLGTMGEESRNEPEKEVVDSPS